jgi:hypothetical protein
VPVHRSGLALGHGHRGSSEPRYPYMWLDRLNFPRRPGHRGDSQCSQKLKPGNRPGYFTVCHSLATNEGRMGRAICRTRPIRVGAFAIFSWPAVYVKSLVAVSAVVILIPPVGWFSRAYVRDRG